MHFGFHVHIQAPAVNSNMASIPLFDWFIRQIKAPSLIEGK